MFLPKNRFNLVRQALLNAKSGVSMRNSSSLVTNSRPHGFSKAGRMTRVFGRPSVQLSSAFRQEMALSRVLGIRDFSVMRKLTGLIAGRPDPRLVRKLEEEANREPSNVVRQLILYQSYYAYVLFIPYFCVQ